MIQNLKYIITKETNPYKNLALEEYLLKNVKKDEVILYLWQNEKTVVIGRNQNPWKECRVAELEKDGGRLVRRLSGGGAVFHDLGNLNFTFLAAKENYDVNRQLEVIIKAVNRFGIPAERSGRNDITAEGRKFSGNAFYSDGEHCYHHGTLLVKVDMNMLSHYLNVSREKLVTKGVESVRARVANLTEYTPELEIAALANSLIEAFGGTYGQGNAGQRLERLKEEALDRAELQVPKRLEEEALNRTALQELEKKYSSYEWNFGRKMEFNFSLEQRYSWGDIDLRFAVDSGRIVSCAAYSDALETQYFEQLSSALTGCRFHSDQMAAAAEGIAVASQNQGMQEDILQLLKKAEL